MSKASKRREKIVNSEFTPKSQAAIRKIAGGAQVLVSDALPQEEKISHALQTLLKMEVPEELPLKDLRGALRAVVLAWNISLYDTEKHAGLIQMIMDDRFPDVEEVMRQRIVDIVKRGIITKQLFYPDDKRFVVAHELRQHQSRMFVSASAIRISAEQDLPMPHSDW